MRISTVQPSGTTWLRTHQTVFQSLFVFRSSVTWPSKSAPRAFVWKRKPFRRS